MGIKDIDTVKQLKHMAPTWPPSRAAPEINKKSPGRGDLGGYTPKALTSLMPFRSRRRSSHSLPPRAPPQPIVTPSSFTTSGVLAWRPPHPNSRNFCNMESGEEGGVLPPSVLPRVCRTPGPDAETAGRRAKRRSTIHFVPCPISLLPRATPQRAPKLPRTRVSP